MGALRSNDLVHETEPNQLKSAIMKLIQKSKFDANESYASMGTKLWGHVTFRLSNNVQ